MIERIRKWLGRPAAPRWVLLISLVLASPALPAGVGADDHIHELILQGSDSLQGFRRDANDLFVFATPDTNLIQMNEGVFPWWMDPEALFAFWRPLSSWTHRLDFLLWPDAPWLAHLHSLLWFGLGLYGVWSLFGHLVRPRWVAVLAFVLFAWDDARGAPVAWIANRHAAISFAIAIWVLWAHHRYRVQGFKPGAWLAPACLLVALLASEGAVSACAYLFAHALFIDSGSWRKRLGSLWPYALVVVGWRVVYRQLGYGVVGSGLYLDPLQAPLDFASRALERGPVMWLAQLALPWAEAYNAFQVVAPVVCQVLVAVGIGVLAVLAVALVPLWRQPIVRFGMTGALLATVPVCTTFPSDRMLAWMGLGASVVLAHLVVMLVDRRDDFATSRARRLLAGPLLASIVAVHMVIAPLFFPMRARGIVGVRQTLERADEGIPKDPSIRDRTVVLVNPPGDPFVSYVPIMRAADGVPRPRMLRWLATGISDVSLRRLDEHTLRVRQHGGYLQGPSERLLRSARRPFEVGQVIDLAETRIRVVELADDWRPAVVDVRFRHRLEDPSLVWLRWGTDRYVPFQPPRVGEHVRLSSINYLQAALGRDVAMSWLFEPGRHR